LFAATFEPLCTLVMKLRTVKRPIGRVFAGVWPGGTHWVSAQPGASTDFPCSVILMA